MITVSYRVEVEVPKEILCLYWSRPYYHKIEVAKRYSKSSGSNYFDTDNGALYEWAEFDTLTDAQACEQKFNEAFNSLLKAVEL